MRKGILAGVAILAITMAGTAGAADLKKGKRVYNKCKACHALEDGKNKVGPHLHAIIGRKAGSIDGFKYSKAMMDSGITWDEATLTEYLKAPKKYVKGTKMAFAGLKKDADIENVIAYILEETK